MGYNRCKFLEFGHNRSVTVPNVSWSSLPNGLRAADSQLRIAGVVELRLEEWTGTLLIPMEKRSQTAVSVSMPSYSCE
jgi:hypothetical protein